MRAVHFAVKLPNAQGSRDPELWPRLKLSFPLFPRCTRPAGGPLWSFPSSPRCLHQNPWSKSSCLKWVKGGLYVSCNCLLHHSVLKENSLESYCFLNTFKVHHPAPTCSRPASHCCYVAVHAEVRKREQRKKEKKSWTFTLQIGLTCFLSACSSDSWRSLQDEVGRVQQEASMQWKASELPMHNEWMANRQNAKVDKSSLKSVEQALKGFFCRMIKLESGEVSSLLRRALD